MLPGIKGRHTRRALIIFVCIGLLVSFALNAAPGFAEEPLRHDEESDSGLDDAYYNAMLRSINLDRNRWKSLSKSVTSGPWFYDTKSIVRKSGRVSVGITVYPNPHNTGIYRSIYADHSKIRRIVMVTEIDCARKTYRQPHIRSFGYDEQILSEYTYESSKQKFSAITVGTMTDTLRGIVCTGSRKVRK